MSKFKRPPNRQLQYGIRLPEVGLTYESRAGFGDDTLKIVIEKIEGNDIFIVDSLQPIRAIFFWDNFQPINLSKQSPM